MDLRPAAGRVTVRVGSTDVEGSRRAVVAAFAANVGIAVAKFVGWLFTGSSSLLAEGFHSVADTTDQGLLLWGQRRAERQADRSHPFGYTVERYFWAFVVSILIFSLGSLLSLREAYQQIREPEPLTDPLWAFAILVVALVLDGFSLRTAAREADRHRRGSWWEFIRSTKRAHVTVILLEDSAAVTGVVLATIAVGLTVVTGNPIYDALGSLAIGILLGLMAAILAVEMKSLLIGESAQEHVVEAIHEVISAHDAVSEVRYLRTLHFGPEQLFVETKVVVADELTAREVALVIDEVESAIRERVPAAQLISIEPDIPRPDDPDVPPYVEEE